MKNVRSIFLWLLLLEHLKTTVLVQILLHVLVLLLRVVLEVLLPLVLEVLLLLVLEVLLPLALEALLLEVLEVLLPLAPVQELQFFFAHPNSRTAEIKNTSSLFIMAVNVFVIDVGLILHSNFSSGNSSTISTVCTLTLITLSNRSRM